MEAEVPRRIGGGLGEAAPDARLTHRNGYRARPWKICVGEIEQTVEGRVVAIAGWQPRRA